MTRRRFLRSTGQGAAGALAAPSILSSVLGQSAPSETLQVGCIGIGVRGENLVEDAAEVPGTKVVAICDVYKPYRDKGVRLGRNPDAKTCVDYQELLADKNVQALTIATPDHWHSKMLLDAAAAKKDVYIEKGWTRSVAEAKEMLRAVKTSGIVMQLGHQARDRAAGVQAAEVIRQGILGPITLVRTGRFGNTPRGQNTWRWYGGYGHFQRPDPAQVERDLDWDRWLGSTPKRPFSMEHFWHWRCYWTYGTGVAGDLLSHELDFVQSILRMGIPDTCTTVGLNALLKDGREVPDTWNAVYHYEKQDLTVTFDSSMNSEAMGQAPEFRGKDALLKFDGIAHNVTTFEVHGERVSKGGGILAKFDPAKTPPQPSHMADFLSCVRTRKKPRCNEDEAFVEAVTLVMSVESYRHRCVVRWDPAKQEIVPENA